MVINEHTLVHAKDAGNGYHGICQHCGLPLVTDLGYCSWDDTICNPKILIEERKRQEEDAAVSEVFRLAYEYLRFKNNFDSPFDKDGWYYIRGTAEPSFMEVKKARKKYKFDLIPKDIVKHILWYPSQSKKLKLVKNQLVWK